MGQFILPRDIPLDRYPKPEVFLAEGKRIAEAAQQRGIVMRVMGPLALHYYFPEQIDLYAKLERLGDRYFTDIDYATYGKTRKHLVKFMESVGYECDLQTMAMTGQTRHIYFGGAVPMIDVFIDKLDYCHEVNYDGRLESDPWSVSLADFGEDDTKKVNVGYVARRFADDWGFWYTGTTNLDRVKEHVGNVDALSDDQKAKIRQVADEVRARIDQEPKTKKWEKRAKKGTKKIWYNTGFSDW